MSRLDSVRDYVLEQASRDAAELRAQAEAEVAAIEADATARIEALEAQRAEERAREEAAGERRRHSLATLERRRSDLEARQRLIDETLDQAAAMLAALPAERRRDLYIRELSRLAEAGWQVQFSRADHALADEVLAALPVTLERLPDADDFSGGFVLRRDRVQSRHSFEDSLANGRESWVELAAGILFAEDETEGQAT